MVRVLITRPQPAKTAKRLQAAGLEPIVLPLTEIRALPLSDIDAAGFDAVAVTSANAIAHAPRSLIAALRHLGCFAVGERTASVARAGGLENAVGGTGDAAALAAMVIEKTAANARLLYLCGKVRHDEFETILAGSGRTVVAAETYDTVTRPVSPQEARHALADRPVDAVLVYSQHSAEVLLPLLREASLASLFSGARILCLSPRVAEAFSASSLRVQAAQRPNEDALFDLLRNES